MDEISIMNCVTMSLFAHSLQCYFVGQKLQNLGTIALDYMCLEAQGPNLSLVILSKTIF